MTVTRKKGGPGWEVKDADKFDGCESDIVIDVGNGNIEGFTRARLKLFIVTFQAFKGEKKT